MTTQILITIYLMIGSYILGENIDYIKRELEYNKYFLSLGLITCLLLSPIYYLYEFIKFILVEIRKYFLLWGWWKYYTDKSFGKNFNDEKILYLKHHKPKHKLEALFIKKILKRIEDK